MQVHQGASIISVVLCLIAQLLGPVLANWNLDSLTGKHFTERRALDDAWEFFGGVDLELVGEAGGKNRSAAGIELLVVVLTVADIDEVHLEPVASC